MSKNFLIKDVKVHYLRLDKNDTKPENENLKFSFIELPKPIDVQYYLYLYNSVGQQYNWLDRAFMSDNELDSLINKPNTHLFILEYEGETAGWCEYVNEPQYTELLYFGLFPQYVGKGIGKQFLSVCINKAWTYNPKWIQLNTCDFDHENAMHVYRKFGFIEYNTTTEKRKVLI